MLRLETEAGNVHIVHPYEEPEVLNKLQANGRKWACRHDRKDIDIKYKHGYFTFFFNSWWRILSKLYLGIV